MIVILDSNIWLAELGLRSPLGAVARLYLQQKRARLALPEVIRLEVEHNLRNQLRNYVRALQTTHRQLLTVFGTLKELVVPDAVAIEGRVAQLFAKLCVEVLEVRLVSRARGVPFSRRSTRCHQATGRRSSKTGSYGLTVSTFLRTMISALSPQTRHFFRTGTTPRGSQRVSPGRSRVWHIRSRCFPLLTNSSVTSG